MGKSSEGVPGYSRWVNRSLGRHLAALAFRVGLTPNQVTVLSGVCTLSAIAGIATVRPTAVSGVVVAVVLLLGYALDSADGQLARLRGGGSPAGEWTDHVVDALKNATIHLAVAVCWFRFYDLDHPGYLLIPLGFSAVATTFFMGLVLADLLRRINFQRQGIVGSAVPNMNPDQHAPFLRSIVVLPNDYGVFCLAMTVLASHLVFGVVYSLLFAANAVFLVVGAYRWFHEMRALSA
ncbi:CDP-alcohol phosphatidyltransferase family protein [Jatrophihabitans endophyticus]|uniref:CDP-alcohol phosphatidyltransferase family protein n=1 Tax=Jatrophihabitans endophyticus TaxID=1206085 RepID=UPI00190E944D|nr:CDP-alcohol phosphatidyltransferase family protein [Jatrophihabitans endophyticus]